MVALEKTIDESIQDARAHMEECTTEEAYHAVASTEEETIYQAVKNNQRAKYLAKKIEQTVQHSDTNHVDRREEAERSTMRVPEKINRTETDRGRGGAKEEKEMLATDSRFRAAKEQRRKRKRDQQLEQSFLIWPFLAFVRPFWTFNNLQV